MLNRRNFIASASAGALATVPPTLAHVAKLVGVEDRPYEAQKFRGEGWYAFASERSRCTIVQFVERDEEFLRLSDGPGCEGKFYFSDRTFDAHCVGFCQKVDRTGRPV